MIRLTLFLFSLFFLNQCSFNEGSRLWNDKEKELENQTNIKKIFTEEKKITTEFNQDLKLNLEKIQTKNKITDNKNDYGVQDYDGLIKKIGSYKFSKLKNVNQLNFKPAFLNEGLGLLRENIAKQTTKGTFDIQLLFGGLYGIQMTIAYLLMLVIMTYELLMFLAIILGLAIGKIYFRPFKPLPVTNRSLLFVFFSLSVLSKL